MLLKTAELNARVAVEPDLLEVAAGLVSLSGKLKTMKVLIIWIEYILENTTARVKLLTSVWICAFVYI